MPFIFGEKFYFPFGQILLRITADQPLSACCMDPAELRLLLASDTSGTICAVDICFQVSKKSKKKNNQFPPEIFSSKVILCGLGRPAKSRSQEQPTKMAPICRAHHHH